MAKKNQASPPSVVVPSVDEQRDFSDPESERVLRAAALAMARELGRQAADDMFNARYNVPTLPPAFADPQAAPATVQDNLRKGVE